MNDIYEAKEYVDFTDKVIDFDRQLPKIAAHLKESYNVEAEYDEEGNIILHSNDANESQSLLDAREYLISNIDTDFIRSVKID